MNRQNLEIFGLDEGASREDITAAYERLREKYLEERFLDGEAGNNAARMLTKIETAYNELMSELSEKAASEDGASSFSKVEELLRDGNLQEAQRVLDGFNERPAEWHYLQSVLFYRKMWMNESKKQLEIAIQLEPNNEKYRDSYKKLNDKLNNAANRTADGNGGSTYQGQTVNSGDEEQMGGNFCASCIQCCYLNLCINCLCNSCCR